MAVIITKLRSKHEPTTVWGYLHSYPEWWFPTACLLEGPSGNLVILKLDEILVCRYLFYSILKRPYIHISPAFLYLSNMT